MIRQVIAVCLSCTAAGLRAGVYGTPAQHNVPAADVKDPTLRQNMMDTFPPEMALLQTGAEEAMSDPTQYDIYRKREIESGADNLTNDSASFSHLQNRNIVFMGDSTIEELFWDTIFTLNENSPDEGGWSNVPATQCTYQKCSDVCGGRDAHAPHQHLKMNGHCSDTSLPECSEAMPQIQKLNTNFSFLWTAMPFICYNGIPGLYGTIHNPLWMEVFHEFAARTQYDDVIFSSGAHDFFAGGNATQYRIALETFLGMLEPLGKRLVFISPKTPTFREINLEIVARHPRWRLIDRQNFSRDLHCSKANWTHSLFRYKRSGSCHNMVREIFGAQDVAPETHKNLGEQLAPVQTTGLNNTSKGDTFELWPGLSNSNGLNDTSKHSARLSDPSKLNDTSRTDDGTSNQLRASKTSDTPKRSTAKTNDTSKLSNASTPDDTWKLKASMPSDIWKLKALAKLQRAQKKKEEEPRPKDT